MSKTTARRIHLKRSEGDFYEEGRAAATIKPGHLVALDSTGKLVPHASSGGNAELQFAIEDALQGKTIDDNYSTGDLVRTVIGRSGTVIQAWLKVGQNVTPANVLTSNGDGTLKVVAGTNAPVGVPLESVDLSQSGDVDTRIRVRLL